MIHYHLACRIGVTMDHALPSERFRRKVPIALFVLNTQHVTQTCAATSYQGTIISVSPNPVIEESQGIPPSETALSNRIVPAGVSSSPPELRNVSSSASAVNASASRACSCCSSATPQAMRCNKSAKSLDSICTCSITSASSSLSSTPNMCSS
jgi:hypothetical protein